MDMFASLLNAIPKTRSEFVNDLEIPEVTLSPYMWTDLDDSVSATSDSVVPPSEGDKFERGSLSTDSSLPLSRAMTDSDISYGRYKRYMSRRHSNPFDSMRDAVDLYPSEYLSSLYKYRYRSYTPPLYSSQELADMYADERRRYNRELRLKMKRILDSDYVYDTDLLDLEDSLRSLDYKVKDTLAYRRYDYLNLDWPYNKYYSYYYDYDYPGSWSYWRWKRRYWPYTYSYTV